MSKFTDRFRCTSEAEGAKPLPMGTASFSKQTGTGRTDTANVGSMTSIALSHGELRSCSWKIAIKNGATQETQQTDYPRTRPDIYPNATRGTARGSNYSPVSLQR